jgi:hypothetical protein
MPSFFKENPMARMCLVCAVLFALPFLGRAEGPPTETLIRLKVQAEAAPKPALRYLLLPELREMLPGNQVQGFMKAFMEQHYLFHDKTAVDDREKWLEAPLKDLPLDKLHNYGGLAVTQANYAARLDNPDWQTLLKMRSEGISLLIPEVQQMRTLASVLKIRFRAEIADRRFDDALVTAKTLFALARLLGEHPTLIGDLVGIAIASIALDPLEEMLQQPGCPNLFWALTDLPRPFIDLRKGMQGERMLLTSEFGTLDEKAVMTEAQLQKVVTHLKNLLNVYPEKGEKVRVSEWIADRVKNKSHLLAARQRLVEYGLAQGMVQQFPALQVVLLDGKYAHEVKRDEAMKALTLPYWQVEPLLAGIPKVKDEDGPFALLVPAVIKVRMAQARLEKRFALLRCVEALRLYSSEHDGKLPEKLADIKLPLPVDPTTGRPFLYRFESGTASLWGTPPPSMEKLGHYNVRYEVTITK